MVRAFKLSWISLILLGFTPVSHAAFETKLSEIHLQSVLQGYFPISEYAAFARVTLNEPAVKLEKGSKDISLIIPMDAKLAGNDIRQGHVTIFVSLSYKHTTGGVYLDNPRIQQLVIPGVSEKLKADLRGIVEAMATNSLPLVRIYKVKEKDLNHSLAKSALKAFDIDDAHLRLEFGFK